jgi:hypothetical protein
MVSGGIEALACCRSARVILNPNIHFDFEKIQRQRAVAKQFVVKFADIESCSEGFFGFRSNGADLELADFITQRLGGNRNVTVHLRSGAAFSACQRRVHEKADRLIA